MESWWGLQMVSNRWLSESKIILGWFKSETYCCWKLMKLGYIFLFVIFQFLILTFLLNGDSNMIFQIYFFRISIGIWFFKYIFFGIFIEKWLECVFMISQWEKRDGKGVYERQFGSKYLFYYLKKNNWKCLI